MDDQRADERRLHSKWAMSDHESLSEELPWPNSFPKHRQTGELAVKHWTG